jgi:hypothetical protein
VYGAYDLWPSPSTAPRRTQILHEHCQHDSRAPGGGQAIGGVKSLYFDFPVCSNARLGKTGNERFAVLLLLCYDDYLPLYLHNGSFECVFRVTLAATSPMSLTSILLSFRHRTVGPRALPALPSSAAVSTPRTTATRRSTALTDRPPIVVIAPRSAVIVLFVGASSPAFW